MITVTQTCDGCGETRFLNSSSAVDSDSAGWREVSNVKHLCLACIRKALDLTKFVATPEEEDDSVSS